MQFSLFFFLPPSLSVFANLCHSLVLFASFFRTHPLLSSLHLFFPSDSCSWRACGVIRKADGKVTCWWTCHGSSGLYTNCRICSAGMSHDASYISFFFPSFFCSVIDTKRSGCCCVLFFCLRSHAFFLCISSFLSSPSLHVLLISCPLSFFTT